MGYRSDTCLRLSEEAESVIQVARKMSKDLDSLLEEAEKPNKGDYAWYCVKWYEQYPEISALESLLSDLKEDDYGFIRVGEETNDIEFQGDPAQYDMYIRQSIEW